MDPKDNRVAGLQCFYKFGPATFVRRVNHVLAEKRFQVCVNFQGLPEPFVFGEGRDYEAAIQNGLESETGKKLSAAMDMYEKALIEKHSAKEQGNVGSEQGDSAGESGGGPGASAYDDGNVGSEPPSGNVGDVEG